MTASRGARALAGALFLLLLATTVGWRVHEVDRRDRSNVTVVDRGPIPAEVNESSGLAVSRAYPELFWTHNDSGDEPRLYALDGAANLVATVDVLGAEARDWEAMDVGPCPSADAEAEWCLYIGDTGDNGRQRSQVTIYVVPEPDPSVARSVDVVASVHFTYARGPLDVEAIAVAPDGAVVLASKGRVPSMWLFEIPSAAFGSAAAEEPLQLDPLARLPIEPAFMAGRWLTGGALDADGSLLALRTYTEVYFYEWPIAEELKEAAPTCFLGAIEPIGEAISFSSEGALFLTSESPDGRVGHLLEIECEGLTR